MHSFLDGILLNLADFVPRRQINCCIKRIMVFNKVSIHFFIQQLKSVGYVQKLSFSLPLSLDFHWQNRNWWIRKVIISGWSDWFFGFWTQPSRVSWHRLLAKKAMRQEKISDFHATSFAAGVLVPPTYSHPNDWPQQRQQQPRKGRSYVLISIHEGK